MRERNEKIVGGTRTQRPSRLWARLQQTAEIQRALLAQTFENKEHNLVYDPLSDWKPVKAEQDWRNVVEFFGPCYQASRSILNPLDLLDFVIRQTEEQAVAIVQL